MSEYQRIAVEVPKNGTSYGLYWKADVTPIAVVIIMTGMEEHLKRYDDFAKYLNKEGFHVYGVDHFGQGENILPDGSNRGVWPKSGFRKQVQAVDALVQKVRLSCLPIFIFSHSMGSYMCQDYIQRYTQHVSKVVLCGANGKNPFVGLGYHLAKLITSDKNREKPSKFLTKMMFGSFNKKVKDPESPNSWISYNKENVAKYDADPDCGFGPNRGFCLEFLKGMNRLWKKKFLQKIRHDLDIFLISGTDDPVSNYGKGIGKLEKMYKKYHISNVSTKLYPHMRHEILNEEGHEEVYKDVVEFFKADIEHKNIV